MMLNKSSFKGVVTDERILFEKTMAPEYPDAPAAQIDFAWWLWQAARGQAPIPMILYCPACGEQHIDAPEDHEVDKGSHIDVVQDWTNPPHRSHLCHACGTIWRPADVCTTGVARIETKGKADTWSPE